MRYLAFLLLVPWLLILCWGYWAYPKSLPRTGVRRTFDVVAMVLSLVVAAKCVALGFDQAEVPTIDEFGRTSGAIWQQVLPALYGYGAFTVVLVLAMVLRHLLWRRRRG